MKSESESSGLATSDRADAHPSVGVQSGTCQQCEGKGTLLYGSTATYHPAVMAGAAMTQDVCSVCWGSGTTHRKGTDILALTAALATATAEIERHKAIAEEYITRTDPVLTRAKATGRDAARYRWLRECSWARSDRTVYVLKNEYINGKLHGQSCPSREELDAIVDAALDAEQQG